MLDPAVGSGHFLVSALNELLALKADLKLLLDDAGQYLDYSLRVEHDELLILDNATDQPARYQVAAYDAATGQRTAPTADTTFRAAAIPKLPPPTLDAMVAEHVRTVAQATLQEAGWTLASASGQELLEKLKAAGTPLGEYVKGKIYRGILTGLNPAFVIKSEVRDQLIAADARSAEIIKPFLAGRDVKRYRQSKPTSYLILLPSGWTRKQLGWQRNQRGTYVVAPETPTYPMPWDALLANYPAVAAHLLPFEEAATARSDKGNFWWELRACDYYDEFEKPKISFPDIAPSLSFTLDTNGNYLANTGYFLPTDNKYLLGVLNSTPIDFFFRSLTNTIRGGYLRFFKQYMDQLLIPAATAAQQAKIAALVETILAARAADATADATADTAEAEAQVDALVAGLYGLTPAEAAVVAGQ